MPRYQAEPPSDESNGTGTAAGGNSSNSSASSGASGEGGGGGILNPGEFFEGGLEWLFERGMEAVVEVLDLVPRLVNGMAAPGEPNNPSTWSNPTNGMWPGVYDALPFTYALGVVGLVIAGTLIFRHKDAYTRRRRFYTLAVCTFMYLLTEFVAPMGLHLGSTIGRAVAPSGSEFAADPGSLTKFGLGLLVAVILLKVQLAILVIGLFVLAAQYFLTHLVVFLWPLGWALRAFDGFPRSLGDFVIYLYGALIALNVGQALVLRLLFELPWGVTNIVGSLMGFLATTAGLAFALIWLPKSMLLKATAGSAVGLGVASGMKEAGGRSEQLKERVQDRVSEVRNTNSDSGRGRREAKQYGSPARSPVTGRGGDSEATSRPGGSNSSSMSGGYVNINSAVENPDGGADTSSPESRSRNRRQTRYSQRNS